MAENAKKTKFAWLADKTIVDPKVAQRITSTNPQDRLNTALNTPPVVVPPPVVSKTAIKPPALKKAPGEVSKNKAFRTTISTIEKIDAFAYWHRIKKGDVLTHLVREYEKSHKIKPVPKESELTEE